MLQIDRKKQVVVDQEVYLTLDDFQALDFGHKPNERF